MAKKENVSVGDKKNATVSDKKIIIILKGLIKTNGILRIIVFVLIIAILALIYSGVIFTSHIFIADRHPDGTNLVRVVCAGNFFAILFIFLPYLTGEDQVAKRFITEISFDVVHAILNIAAGSVLFYFYYTIQDDPYPDDITLIVAAIMFLVLSLVLSIDGFILIKNYKDDI
uniref:Uncharacterized protein n=1 Tax=Strigamia maritima TaxID=126957 RepID=T1JF21_STRMM